MPFLSRAERRQTKKVPIQKFSLEDLHKAQCTACPLNATAVVRKLHHPKMEATGSNKPVAYILGEAPGTDEDRQGVQFIGKSGQFLRANLPKEFKNKVRFNNVIRCHPDKNRNPTFAETECCRNFIIRDIEETKPKVIIAFGAVALNWCLVNRDRPYGITAWRGIKIPIHIGTHPCWVYPTYHPAYVMRQQFGKDFGMEIEYQRLFKNDLKRVVDDLENWEPPVIEDKTSLYDGVRLIREDFDSLLKFLKRAGGENSAIDIETSRLRPYSQGARLLSVSVAVEGKTVAFPWDHPKGGFARNPDVQRALRRYLKGRGLKIAQNAAFELEWIGYAFGENYVRAARWEDTMAQGYVLDHRGSGRLKLDSLCLQYLGLKLKDVHDLDMDRLERAPVDQLLKYNALDAKYTLKLWEVLREEICFEELETAYADQRARIPTIAIAQIRGLNIDFDAVAEFDKKYRKEIKEQRETIAGLREIKTFVKTHGKFNPASNKDCVELFKNQLGCPEGAKKDGKYSVDVSVLEKIKKKPAKAILRLRQLVKLHSTYIQPYGQTVPLRASEPSSKTEPLGISKPSPRTEPLGKSVSSHVYPDGKIHSQFNTTLTSTGRLSSEKPNLQNLPNRTHPEIRSFIYVLPKRIILSVDYGQLEARVIAMVSKDKKFSRYIIENHDIHLDWAERISHVDDRPLKEKADGDMKKFRSFIKTWFVFPAFYGSQPEPIANNIGLGLSDTRELFDEFWDEFKGVARWQRALLKFYKENFYIACMNGRRRYGPMSKEQIINTPIQGSASDILVDSGNRLSEIAASEDLPHLQLLMNVHDELVFEIPKKSLDDAVDRITDEMLNPSYDWVTLPLEVEVKCGPNWYDLKPLGKFVSEH
jgi:DNA polymerase I